MKARPAAFLLVVYGLFSITILVWAQAEWVRTEKTDPLTNLSYVRFTLDGKFLQAPSKGGVEKPTFVLECDPSKTRVRGKFHGKTLRTFIVVGTVVDDLSSSSESLEHPGLIGKVPVRYRRDDDKKVHDDLWSHSTNFSGLFLSEVNFNDLLFGHFMEPVEGKVKQTRKVVISVPEYLGADVVMQFDFPDLTTVADSCGLIEHKR